MIAESVEIPTSSSINKLTAVNSKFKQTKARKLAQDALSDIP